MKCVLFMVLILDSQLEIGAHVYSDLGYLICLRHSFSSRAHTKLNFKERPIFRHIRTAQYLLSYHLLSLVCIVSYKWTPCSA